MELNQPPPSSQNPDSDLSRQPPGAQPIAQPTSPPSSEDIYNSISSYPFHSDQEYQLGLAAILGHPETPSTESELTSNQDLVLQAQCFYLARKYGLGQIDVEAYKEWLTVSRHAKEAIEQGANGTRSPAPVLEQERPTAPTPSTAAAASNLPVQPPLSVSDLTVEPPTEQERPSAPTPSTAAAASTLSVQPHTQTASTSNPAPAQDTGPAPPYPNSFADIVDLITQNKPIPGIEEIPDTVLEPGSSKQDKAVRRKKPWEMDETAYKTTGQAEAEVLNGAGAEKEQVDIEHRKRTGEGVMKILQPDAVTESGLIARE